MGGELVRRRLVEDEASLKGSGKRRLNLAVERRF